MAGSGAWWEARVQGGVAGEGIEEAEGVFGRLVERLGARLWGLRAWFFFVGKLVGVCGGEGSWGRRQGKWTLTRCHSARAVFALGKTRQRRMRIRTLGVSYFSQLV